MLKKLRSSGAVFSEKYAQAAFFNSFLNGNIGIAVDLLNNDVNPKIRDKKYASLLQCVIIKGNNDFVKQLIEKCADPNTKYDDFDPPLFLLAKNGNTELIKFLIDN